MRDYGVAGQIGLEPTLAEFIATLVDVFREVRRVLRPDGTCFVNMGDSYASAWPCNRRSVIGQGSLTNGKRENRAPRMPDGLKEKDLMMVPARLAIALCDDGWYLRSDIIWHKKAPMPESVTDRPTSAHEHVFLLTKQSRYFYDADAVREPHEDPKVVGGVFVGSGGVNKEGYKPNNQGFAGGSGVVMKHREYNPLGRNLRNVWTLGPEPYPDAHFATFPTEIPRRCIKAGTSERGCCPACGASWRRVVEAAKAEPDLTQRSTAHYNTAERYGAGNGGNGGFDKLAARMRDGTHGKQTTGWEPTCSCDAGEPVPSTILDPFLGSGTTLLVADQLGRHGIGIELNPEYAEMARRRIVNDAPLFASVPA